MRDRARGGRRGVLAGIEHEALARAIVERRAAHHREVVAERPSAPCGDAYVDGPRKNESEPSERSMKSQSRCD